MERIEATLVSAGYFRARIKSLDPFDKILGGMAWCVSNIGIEGGDHLLDDVVFNEDDSLRRKITVSEQLIQSLRLLQSPFELQSHQIQGLDTKNVFPVIQWLVRHVLQTREERHELTRTIALRKGPKAFPSECMVDVSLIERIVKANVPKRTMRKRYPMDDIEKDIEATILEYGGSLQNSGGPRVSQGESEDFEGVMEIVEDSLPLDRVLTEVDRDEISRLDQSLVTLLEESEKNSPVGTLLVLDRKIASVQKSIDGKKELLMERREVYESLLKEKEELALELRNVESELERIEKTIEQSNHQKESTEMLRLIKLYEKLKEEHSSFKSDCKKKVEDMEREIEALKGKLNNDRLEKMQKMLDTELDKLSSLREVLAKEQQEVYLLERQLEEIPSDAELLQYEKRFIELHELVSFIRIHSRKGGCKAFGNKKLLLRFQQRSTYPRVSRERTRATPIHREESTICPRDREWRRTTARVHSIHSVWIRRYPTTSCK